MWEKVDLPDLIVQVRPLARDALTMRCCSAYTRTRVGRLACSLPAHRIDGTARERYR